MTPCVLLFEGRLRLCASFYHTSKYVRSETHSRYNISSTKYMWVFSAPILHVWNYFQQFYGLYNHICPRSRSGSTRTDPDIFIRCWVSSPLRYFPQVFFSVCILQIFCPMFFPTRHFPHRYFPLRFLTPTSFTTLDLSTVFPSLGLLLPDVFHHNLFTHVSSPHICSPPVSAS